MARSGLFLLVCAGLVLSIKPLFADPPAADAEAAFHNTLVVQRAMEQARFFLMQEGNAEKAVQILEQHLAKINGNPVYLRLLRDAYRTYIKDLWLARQEPMARKIFERLAILDPDAVNDATLRPLKGPPNAKDLAKAPAATEKNPGYYTSPISTVPSKSTPTQPSTFRAKIDNDPFDLAFQLRPAESGAQQQQARHLLAQAEAEFGKRHFSQAKVLFEQAHQADPSVTVGAHPRWAYCKLNSVVELLNQGKVDASALPALQREVRLAMEMAPGLAETGKWLLREMDQRGKSLPPMAPGTALAAEPAGAVQHLGRNAQGWQVAETAHFRVYHNQSRELAERAARIAEQTRRDMFRKWFGSDGPEWNPKCDLYLHASAADYTRLTAVSGQSPGHSRIDSDKTSGRVFGRRMDLRCDHPGMLEAILPHETTHVVLAGQFGRHPVPRWADEGMAVLTEPRDKVDQHRRNFARSYQERQLFDLKELMYLEDYPQPRRIAAFYAQSVLLVDFLSRQRGPQVFAEFLRDALQTGYDNALRKHYNFRDFNDLQARWNQQVLAEVNGAGPALAGR